MKLNTEGQVLIEGAISILIAWAAVVSLFMIFYLFYFSFWTDHTLSETNMCVVETDQTTLCKLKSIALLSKGLFIPANKISLSISKNDREIRTEAHFQILEGAKHNQEKFSRQNNLFSFKKTLRLQ